MKCKVSFGDGIDDYIPEHEIGQPRTHAHFTDVVMTFYASEMSLGTRLKIGTAEMQVFV